MKLVHPSIMHHIEFQENSIQIIVVENPHLFYDYANDLYTQCNMGGEGSFILSEQDKEMTLSKVACMITSPYKFLSFRKM